MDKTSTTIIICLGVFAGIWAGVTFQWVLGLM